MNVQQITDKFRGFIDLDNMFDHDIEKRNSDLIIYKPIDDLHNQEGDKGLDNRLDRVGQGTAHKTGQLWGTTFRIYNGLQHINRSGLNVLDIGCADAFIRKMIHSGTYYSGTNYVGIDIKAGYVRKASDKMPKCNNPALFIVHDLYERMTFIEDNSVDVIYLMEVLEHVDEKAGFQLMQEIYRILRPKTGVLVLSMPNFHPSYWYVWRKYRATGYPWHLREYTIKEFKTICKKVGLKVKYLYGNLANRRRLLPLLDEREREIFDDLVKYMGPQIPTQVMGQLHPEACGGVVYIVEKR